MGGAGLHGRAFIPLLSSFACAIPGIMATRVIDSRRDRLTTIMVAPLMTCSARIPVYTLIISAFIPARTIWGFLSLQGLVFFGLYALGLISALAVAWVVRKVFWRGLAEPFLMEMPAYKIPDPLNVARSVLQRGQIFLQRAGTIILSMMVLIWFLSTVPGKPAGARSAPRSTTGFLRRHHRPRDPALAGPGRFLLADGGRPDPRHGRARGRRRRARHRLRRAPAARRSTGVLGAAPGPAQWSTGVRPGLPGLVRLRAAVRLDPWAWWKRETNSWLWPSVMFCLHDRPWLPRPAFITYHTAALALGARS